MSKQSILHRAQYAKEFGASISNPGVVGAASAIIAMCGDKSITAEKIIVSEAYAIVNRVYSR
jgi:hypothetical protein